MSFEFGNHKFAGEYTFAIEPIPPQSVQIQSFSVPGLFPTWAIYVAVPSLPPGVFVFGPGHIPSRDILEVNFWNTTEAVTYPGACQFRLVVF